METDKLIEALNAIAQGHALNNDLCMDIGWRTVCAKAADALAERDKQSAALLEYRSIGTPDEFRTTLRRTAEDDKAREEGRLVVLPFQLHGNAIHTVDPTEHLNDLRLSVTWTSESSIIFSAPLGIFAQQLADGLVKLTLQEAEAALGGGEQ